MNIEKLTGYSLLINLKKFILKSLDIIISELFFQVTLIDLRIHLLTVYYNNVNRPIVYRQVFRQSMNINY